VRIPKRGRIYSFNEANEFKWPAGLRSYIKDIKQGKGETSLSYTSRYIGSMVGDIHRTLIYGGIFGYPADSKRPRGKLRLLHEVAPLAFLIEQVGN
jgi:fructose-1,6-bisphosphatase I